MPTDAETLLMTECPGLSESTAGKSSNIPLRLIQQAKEGSAWAFEQIMLRYEQRVFATAWRMLGNEADAHDAVQEVFLRVHKYLSSFRTNEDFGGWLYRIVINVCRDARRRAIKDHRFSSLEAEMETGEIESLRSDQDHEAEAIRAQQRSLIREALETLTEKERAAIVLRDLEGLTTEEVARIMGTSQVTVRSQICSARTKIKQFRDRVSKSTKLR